MSAAASKLQVESPGSEFKTTNGLLPSNLELLPQIPLFKSTPDKPVIAVDLDDVLSQTNEAVAEWHNDKFGTKMDISLFYYYYYWKNPFWGTVSQTFDKVKDFYSTDLIHSAKPVPGAREGIQSLRDMGFRLVIVTARAQDIEDKSWKWVCENFPDLFDSLICTGQFKDAHKDDHGVATKLSKSQVCTELKARLLIDDSAENAIQCVTATNATPVLLFGEYQWNQRLSGPSDGVDEMSYDRRLALENGREFWKEEKFEIPDGAPLWRANDWSKVTEWVRKAKDDGRL